MGRLQGWHRVGRAAGALTAAAFAAVSLTATSRMARTEDLPGWERLPFGGLASAFRAEERPGQWRPVWAVEVRNSNGGAILLHRPGRAQQLLGRVLRPARVLNRSGFYAGLYARGGSISASSRKALRFRGPGPAGTARADVTRLRQGHDLSLTLLPRDWPLGFESPAERGAIQAERPERRTFIWTDSTSGLFGDWAPPVGSPVFYGTPTGWAPLARLAPEADGTTAAPERLLVVVFRPERTPRYLELENWTAVAVQNWRKKPAVMAPMPGWLGPRDGRALAAWDEAGREVSVFGSVYQRVHAVGRIDDTGIARPGQLCTNHPGDVAISTCSGIPRPIQRREECDALSGFQIVPANHARDGMVDVAGKPGYAIGHGVWMIVGPQGKEEGFTLLRRLAGQLSFRIVPEFEGTAPLFAGYLSPRYFQEEDTQDAVPPVRRGHLVRVSRDFGRTWTRLPAIRATPPQRLDGLRRVTHVRIYLPTNPDE